MRVVVVGGGAKGTTTLPMLVHTKGIVMFDYQAPA
jgi:2-aminoethylphosphonate transport system permease protein